MLISGVFNLTEGINLSFFFSYGNPAVQSPRREVARFGPEKLRAQILKGKRFECQSYKKK